MRDKVYNKWITEPQKRVLQNVLVTFEDLNVNPKLTYVDFEINKNGKHEMVNGYPSKNVLAYMYIPTIDIDKKGWRGDYTDGEEPEKDGTYIVCVEIKKYGRVWWELGKGYWRKDKFVGNREIIGWREFPKPFKAKN